MVSVNSLESAIPYLSCIDNRCNGDLELKYASFVDKGKSVYDGLLVCSCGREYKISEGIPYFFDFVEKDKKIDIDEIKADIKKYTRTGEAKFCIDAFTELAYALSDKCKNDFEAIKEIFRYEMEIIKDLPEDKKAMVSQATTAARYNLEKYRGCYILPKYVTEFIQKLDLPDGIIFEGAMATGENLIELNRKFSNEISMGIDISEKMVRDAQKNTKNYDNIFVAQGNLEYIPVKERKAKLININNLIDRIPDPPRIAEEIKRISKKGCVSAIFNCFPIQFVSPDGSKVYVPKEKRMNPYEMTKASGYDPIRRYTTTDPSLAGYFAYSWSLINDVPPEYETYNIPRWEIETIFDGRESLDMEGFIGKRR